jgi:D-serine dehydratase
MTLGLMTQLFDSICGKQILVLDGPNRLPMGFSRIPPLLKLVSKNHVTYVYTVSYTVQDNMMYRYLYLLSISEQIKR